MKTTWDIDINNKTASLREEGVEFKFYFEVEIDDEGEFTVLKKEDLKNNNKIDTFTMATKMRILGEEFQMYLVQMLELEGCSEKDDLEMYKIEDNIYVNEEGAICILENGSFYDTNYYTDLIITQDTPLNLVKLFLYEHNEDIDLTENEKCSDSNKPVTFSEIKSILSYKEE